MSAPHLLNRLEALLEEMDRCTEDEIRAVVDRVLSTPGRGLALVDLASDIQAARDRFGLNSIITKKLDGCRRRL